MQPAPQEPSIFLNMSSFKLREMRIGQFPYFKKRYREHDGYLLIQKACFKCLPQKFKAPRLPCSDSINAQETSLASLLLSLGLQKPPQTQIPLVSRTLLSILRKTAWKLRYSSYGFTGHCRLTRVADSLGALL